MRAARQGLLLQSGVARRSVQYGSSTSDPLPLSQLVADFRSDTVTRIAPGMKQAMFENEEYGDDVYEEDMIVRELELRMASLCGKESALFCATGTMTNQLALRAQLGPLQSLLCDSRAHIYEYEAGGVAYHSQAQCRPIVPTLLLGHRTISAHEVEGAILKADVHHAVTAGVSLENTLWGTVVPLHHIQ
jgi:threonine aldolase